MRVFDYRFVLVILSLLLLAMGCSIDHTGLVPTSGGDKYRIDCVFDRSTGPNGPGDSRFDVEFSYCYNGSPTLDSDWEICEAERSSREFEMRQNNPEWDVSLALAEAGERRLPDEDCAVLAGTPEGVGRRINGISVAGYSMIADESGQLIGDSSLANTRATITGSQLTVSAKFAKWRHADTSGKGQAFLEYSPCYRGKKCPLILRHFEVELADFDIVRPTVLARDIPVRNAKLYTISNYESTVDSRGNFSFTNVRAVVSGVIDGKKETFIFERPSEITGQLKAYRDGAAPQLVLLKINERTPSLAIRGSVELLINKFEAGLKNHSTAKCLRGTLNEKQISRASIESCRDSQRQKSWIFKQHGNGNAYQIKQPYANACLNLKSSGDNREGGPVYLVGCSTHIDQRWSLEDDGSIRHVPSGKCLNVHKSRENREGGLVTVYSCANTPDQRWRFVVAD